jgi:DNA-binding transcriptional ArsR family regulator
MSFRKYVEVTDPKMLRALAHPARTAILAYLMEGPATATECAEAAGQSPSACSYHLRKLAELGFVEEVPSDDGRERRWQTLVQGYGIPKEAQDRPEILAALRPLTRRWVQDNQRVIAEYLENEPRFDPAWRKAASMQTSGAYLTPAQLIELNEAVMKVIDSFGERGKDATEGTMRVHVSFVAFPWPSPRKGDPGPTKTKAKTKRTTAKSTGREPRHDRS